MAEIFDAVTLSPISDTSTPLIEDILQGVDSSSTSTTSTTVPSEKYVEQPDREEIEDVEEQNNEHPKYENPTLDTIFRKLISDTICLNI